MSAERITPVDEFSGIPLPLSPEYMEDRSSRFRPDLHHPWHDRLDPLLCDTLIGRALRHSRVQLSNYDAHHLDYHRDNFDGPAIPTAPVDMLRTIVLSAAGYVPSHAISFNDSGTGKTAKIVALSDLHRARLWSSGRIAVGQPGSVRNFLLEYTLGQDSSRLDESLVDEFLNAPTKLRRMQLGNRILKEFAYQALQPVSPFYNQAYKAGEIPLVNKRTAGRFVLESLGVHQPGMGLHHRLRARLAG